MNRIANIRKWYLWIFLVGYLSLLSYSSFHFHAINLTNIENICEHDGSEPGTANGDSFNSSAFTCQFNLVYSSPYYLDTQKAEINNADHKHEIVQFNSNNDHPRTLIRALIKLRAPPAFS